MKKAVTICAACIFLSMVSAAYAHPPSNIKIAFNSKTKILEAVIGHGTSNPLKHYIDKVEVGLNGKTIITHLISREDNNVSQKVVYSIPDVRNRDILSVEGRCSISGKLKKEIIVTVER